MNGTKGQYDRWFEIIEILKTSQKPVTASKFSFLMRVCERTIVRDIHFLADMHEAPIKRDAATRGYYLSEPTFTLNSGIMSESKLSDLVMAEVMLEALGIMDISKRVRALLYEIGSSQKDVIDNKRAVLSRHIVKAEGDGGAEGHTAVLVRAFTKGQTVRIQHAIEGGSCWRTLSAGRIVVRNGICHVTGQWREQDPRTLEVPVSRILKVQVYLAAPVAAPALLAA
jgi:predicted DNA-binding transcriptional regulator YafY